MLPMLNQRNLTVVLLCFAFTTVGRASTVQFTASFAGVALAAAGRCPAPATTILIDTPGTVDSFGAVTTTQSHCIEPFSSDFTDGIFTFTFSDGSTFFGTYGGTLVPLAPPVFRINGAAVITGGTGIFTTATGSGVASGTNNLSTGEFDFVLRGSVTAPGLTAIPEPGSMLLLAGGLGGILITRCRRRTQL